MQPSEYTEKVSVEVVYDLIHDRVAEVFANFGVSLCNDPHLRLDDQDILVLQNFMILRLLDEINAKLEKENGHEI